MHILTLAIATTVLFFGMPVSSQPDPTLVNLDESIYVRDEGGSWVRYMRETSQNGIRHLYAIPISPAYLQAYEQPAANEELGLPRY